MPSPFDGSLGRRGHPAAFAVVLAALLGFGAGCSSVRVNYFGPDLGSSDNVDVYYAKGDVARKFRVVGRAVGTAPEDASTEDLYDRFVAKARSKGADGIIFANLGKEVTGSTSQSVGSGASRRGISGGATAGRNERTFEWNVEAEFIQYVE